MQLHRVGAHARPGTSALIDVVSGPTLMPSSPPMVANSRATASAVSVVVPSRIRLPVRSASQTSSFCFVNVRGADDESDGDLGYLAEGHQRHRHAVAERESARRRDRRSPSARRPPAAALFAARSVRTLRSVSAASTRIASGERFMAALRCRRPSSPA